MSLQTTIHNERIKLLANAINAAATASFTVGIIGPGAAMAYNLGGAASSVSLRNLSLGSIVFFVVAVALHAAARYVLGGLQE